MTIPTHPRVVVDLSVAPPGGAATYAAGFATGLASADLPGLEEVVVLVGRPWAGRHRDLVDRLRSAGVEVEELDLAAPGSWSARLRRGRVLRDAVDRHRADVAFFPRDVAPRVGVPYVSLVRNLYAWKRFPSSDAVGGSIAAFLLRRMARRSASGAAAVLAVSGVMAAALPPRIRVAGVVHHGCSTPEHERRIEHGEPDTRVAIMVGNVMPNKGIGVVIEGIVAARARGPWDLRIYGGLAESSYVEELQRSAAEHLGPSVFRGPAYGDDLVAVYREADLLIMGGSFESFCLPLVEGMRSGCVIVAPDCDLVREVCGDAAVTYRDGDGRSLASALEVAWAERAVRRRAGLERASSFTWDRTVVQTIALVRAAAGSRTTTA